MAGRRGRLTGPMLRTMIISALLVVVFVALFGAADALFASWVSWLLPDLADTDIPGRLMVAGFVAGTVLAAYYVAANPPKVERAALPEGRTVRRFEWVVPVLCVIGVFLAFLSAQLTALFGGHDFLRRSTGLSYAEYVHQGFGQLTAATAIVLVVVALTLRHAPRSRPADAQLVRLLLGLLCGLALVVVASALHRLQIYEEAYGFTRLRLLVAVFEGWVGLVLLLTMTAGVWLRARWVPKVAVITGVLMIAGLTAANPDAIIAEHNVRRYQTSGRIDLAYLDGCRPTPCPRWTGCRSRCGPASWLNTAGRPTTGSAGTSAGLARRRFWPNDRWWLTVRPVPRSSSQQNHARVSPTRPLPPPARRSRPCGEDDRVLAPCARRSRFDMSAGDRPG